MLTLDKARVQSWTGAYILILTQVSTARAMSFQPAGGGPPAVVLAAGDQRATRANAQRGDGRLTR